MKKTFRILVPLLMLLLIVVSIVWYLFIYDRQFTRDTLLSQARFHDMHGNSKISSMLYDFAYVFSDHDEDVAIELANQYRADGNYTKAEYTLTVALNNSPSPELYTALCKAYVEQDKLLDAVNLLDNIQDPSIKAVIDAQRPQIPVPDFEAGFYSQYMDIRLSSPAKYIFYSTDGEYPSTVGPVYQNPVHLDSGETTIYAIGVAETGLVSPVAVMGYTITGVIEEVVFTDPAMGLAIRELISADPSDVVYTDELWDIKEFTAPENVSTFVDLAYLPNLEKLTIQNQTIDSLNCLSGLGLLTHLDLSGCRFNAEELSVPANLPNLTHLTLSDCGLSTIDSLENAKCITYLDLSSNTLRNLDALSTILTLEELDLNHNAVTSLAAVANLPNLQILKVSYNALTSLTELAQNIQLKQLEAEHNQISSLAGLENMVLMTHLSVDYNYISTVYRIAGCTELLNLSIASNSITDISTLNTLTKLEIFDFSGNHVEALPDWPDGCALKTIDGSYNALASIDGLKNMQQLTHVYMDYNLLTNIDALAENFCLVQVNVYGNAIPNVETLRDHDIIVNYDPTATDA